MNHEVDHCVVAIGFNRDDTVKIEIDGETMVSSHLDQYDGLSGEIKMNQK